MSLAHWIDEAKAIERHVKERWSELTAEEIADLRGAGDKLLRALQERYGVSKAQARAELDAGVGKFRATVGDAVSCAGGAAARAWERGTEGLGDALTGGLEHARSYWDTGRRQARDLCAAGVRAVRARPGTALTAAAALGALLVLLLRRRK
jgi:hypothetical protein